MAIKSRLEALEALEKSPSGFDYLKPKESAKLVEQGLVEVNEAMQDENGAFACRLTPKGEEYMNSLNNSGGATTESEGTKTMTSKFVILNVLMPASKRKGGAGRPSKYPFESLEVGQMFFVPESADQPEPVKSLGSVVTSANRRYAEVLNGETKKNRKGEDVPKLSSTRRFVIRPFSVTDENGNIVHGAGVWRDK